jgi:TonB family protein
MLRSVNVRSIPKILLLFLFVAMTTAGETSTLVWKSFHAPEYPRDAQIAHITGRIKIEFTLNDDGTATITKTSGHPLLLPKAVDTIKTSHFTCSACGKESVFTVEFNFNFADHNCEEAARHPRYTSAMEDPEHVSVKAEPVCTADPRVSYVKVRSLRCLYLWKCGKIWLQ